MHSIYSMWVAGIPALQQTDRQGASTPQRQEALLLQLGTWSRWGEKHKNCNCEVKRRRPESQIDEEEGV